jgi:chitinase
MRFSTATVLTAITAFSSSLVSAFSAQGNNNVVLYWGQNSARNQQSLGSYCESTDADMYVISFLTDFPKTSLNIVGCDETFPGSTLLHCSALAADIKKCQSLGKKVLLSLGGAIGNYGFTSDSEAESYADTLWNLFGNGKADTRPFDDAVVDGFDLDIENGNNVGYAALTKQLRKNFNGGDYYISGAPQCVYPDASLGDALEKGYFDFVFVQFYNNPCGIDKSGFNWDTWKNYAAGSANPNVKIYLGIPASTTSASSGYSTPDAVQSIVSKIQGDSCFGGIMMWDASQAFSNMVNGNSYCSAMKNVLGGSSSGSSNAPSSLSFAEAPIKLVSAAAPSSAPTSEASSQSSAPAFSTFVTFAYSSSVPTFTSVQVTQQDAVAAVESTPASSDAAVTSSVVSTAGPTSASDSTIIVTSLDEVTSIIGTITTTSARSQDTLVSQSLPVATDSSSSTTSAPQASATAGTGAGSVISANDVNGDCSGMVGKSLSSCLNNQFGQNKAIELNSNNAQTEQSSTPKSDSTFNLDSCTEGAVSCYEGKFAICNFNKWVFFDCPATTLCSAATINDQNIVIGCNFESIVLAEESAAKQAQASATAAAQRFKRSVQIGASGRNGLHHVHNAHRN